MCKRFNEGGYWEKVRDGTWTSHVLASHRSTLLSHEAVEITSVMLSYRDRDGNEMARVHQFVRPDGSLAASGKPDPKRLIQDGVMYRLEKKAKS